MSSLLSCLPYFIPRAGSELWLNWCHISGVASTNRDNQGNNMGVEGGKNETGAGRTEMSIFSYSAPKTTPTRGDPYKNNQWKQGEQPPGLTDLCIENVTFWARQWSYELLIVQFAFSFMSLSIKIRIWNFNEFFFNLWRDVIWNLQKSLNFNFKVYFDYLKLKNVFLLRCNKFYIDFPLKISSEYHH